MSFRDEETQRHDPTDARRSAGFATASELRARVAEVMASQKYSIPKRNEQVPCESFSTQTDTLAVRTIGVGDGDTDALPHRREYELDLHLPRPSDFPLLTAAQLLEARKRLSELLLRLEQEILRCGEENEVIRQQALELAGVPVKSSFLTTQEWNEKMSTTVTQRMRHRHSDARGETPPIYWLNQKQETTVAPLSPPRSQRLNKDKPLSRGMQIATSPSIFMKSPTVGGPVKSTAR